MSLVNLKYFHVAWTALRRHHIYYLAYLLTGVLIPKITYRALHGIGKVPLGHILSLGLITRNKLGIACFQRQARELTHRSQSTYSADLFFSWKKWSVHTKTRETIELARKGNYSEELIIGHIDQFYRVFGVFGVLPGLKNIDESNFKKRTETKMDLVLLQDNVLIRKDFQNKRNKFVSEWISLATISGKSNAPIIHHVDEESCQLYTNFIEGMSVYSKIADLNLCAFNTDNKVFSKSNVSDATSQLESIAEKEASHETSLLPAETLCKIEDGLNMLHGLGVVNFGIKPENIVIQAKSGTPYFLDFEKADIYHSKTCGVFGFMRDQDRLRFNKTYGRSFMTEKSVRNALVKERAKKPEWYAPVDFRCGLTVGSIISLGSITHGPGRWEFLNKRIIKPLVVGKRVLDLGSNVGLMPMMMMLSGAREVIGLELSKVNVQRADLVRSIYEWRDIKRYEFKTYNRDMLDILKIDLGQFDVITAYCSLYYLEAKDMAQLVRKASTLAPVMVVQANSASKPTKRKERASVAFLKDLLEINGFSHVKVFAPRDYARPLLVGQV